MDPMPYVATLQCIEGALVQFVMQTTTMSSETRNN